MAQDIVSSLFGVAPQAVQASITNPMFERAAAFANMNPMQQAQFGLYSGGAMLGQGVAGLLGGEDPRLVQARQMQQVKDWIGKNNIDVNSPEGLQQAAQYAQSIGATEGAMVLGQQARTISRASAEEQLKLAQAEAALREKKGTPETQAEQVKYNQFVTQYGPEVGANAFLNWKQSQKVGVAAAGAPASGMVKLPDLATAKDIVTGYVKPYKEKLDSIGVAATNLKEAYNNPQAVPQLRQALTTLTGKDNQTSAKELSGILGSMGLAGNIVESINTVLTGKPTKEVLNNAGQAIRALEQYYGTQYNAARQQGAGVLGEAKLNPTTQKVILPPEYRLPTQTPKTTTKKSISFSDLPQ